jgi:hypothetical protein
MARITQITREDRGGLWSDSEILGVMRVHHRRRNSLSMASLTTNPVTPVTMAEHAFRQDPNLSASSASIGGRAVLSV